MTRHTSLLAAPATPHPALPGLAVTPEIVSAIRAGAWIVFNLSGGRDSSTAQFAVNLFLDCLSHPRERRLAIHADLGRPNGQPHPLWSSGSPLRLTCS